MHTAAGLQIQLHHLSHYSVGSSLSMSSRTAVVWACTAGGCCAVAQRQIRTSVAAKIGCVLFGVPLWGRLCRVACLEPRNVGGVLQINVRSCLVAAACGTACVLRHDRLPAAAAVRWRASALKASSGGQLPTGYD
jgi:hypothetical protein